MCARRGSLTGGPGEALPQLAHLRPFPKEVLPGDSGINPAGDREKNRAAMGADPAWQNYVKKVRPLIVQQEFKLLVPASFFKLALK